MASTSKTTVLAAVEVDKENLSFEELEEIRKTGVSSRFILFDTDCDADLQTLYEFAPELIIEKRPDWVKKHYPNRFN